MKNHTHLIDEQKLENIKIKLYYRFDNFKNGETDFLFIHELLNGQALNNDEKNDFINFVNIQLLHLHPHKTYDQSKFYIYLDRNEYSGYPKYQERKIKQQKILNSNSLNRHLEIMSLSLNKTFSIPICITRREITDLPSYVIQKIANPTTAHEFNCNAYTDDPVYLEPWKAKNLAYENKGGKSKWMKDVKENLLF